MPLNAAVFDEIAMFPRSHLGLCVALGLPLDAIEAAITDLLRERKIVDRGWRFAVRLERERKPRPRRQK